jgi:hypothetical protein
MLVQLLVCQSVNIDFFIQLHQLELVLGIRLIIWLFCVLLGKLFDLNQCVEQVGDYLLASCFLFDQKLQTFLR